MARDLASIMQELDASYTPMRQRINEQLTALPGQADAEIGGLEAKERDYYDNTILAGARDRGVAFSGIPIGERARYGASEFLPAVARVRQSQNQVKGGLIDSLNSIGSEQRTKAMALRDSELSRDEQARQFNENLNFQRQQADRASRGGSGGYSLGGGAPVAAQPRAAAPAPVGGYGYKNGTDGKGGFFFKDTANRPVNALQYSQQSGIPITELLRRMGASGDYNASQALAIINKAPGVVNVQSTLQKYRII